MRTVFLKDISKVSAGNSAPKKDEFSKEGTPFVRAGSLAFLTKGESLDKCEKVNESVALKKRLKLFRKDSILFAKSGMSSKMGRIYQLENDAYVVSHLAIINVNESIANPSYIKYFFILRPPFFLIRDDAYPSIKLEDIKNITLNLPDLPTQNKIVALLDKASALVQKRTDSIALLDELLRAQFLEMFGEYINDNNLKQPLGSQIKKGDRINYGIVQPGKEVKEGISVVRVGDFKNGLISLNNIKKVSKEVESKHKKSRLFGREVLLACVGATIGKVAFVDEKLKGFNIVRATARVNCGDSLNPLFLLLLLQTDFYQFQLKKFSRTVAQPTLNIKQISELQIPIPPIQLQNQFETIYHNIQAQKETLTQSKLELENLYNSLLQRAFSGQLNFNVDIELDALLAAIDLEQDTEKEKYDIKEIVTVYAGRLLERIEEQNFETQTQYQQAKQVVFQMLKEGSLEQTYDEKTKAVKLKLV